MPNYSNYQNPYGDLQFHDTAPDMQGFAAVVANLGNSINQSQNAARMAETERYRIDAETNRAQMDNSLKYMQEVRMQRLQDSQVALQTMKIASDMRETDYRMEQTRKMDDAKWMARDARATLFPQLAAADGAIMKNDLLSANAIIKSAFSIPGVTDDEISLKLLGEYNTRIGQFTIDGKPAVQVLDGYMSKLRVDQPGAPTLSELRNWQQVASSGTDLSQLAQTIATTRGTGEVDTIEAFLRAGQKVLTPEQKVSLQAGLDANRERYLQAKFSDPENPLLEEDFRHMNEVITQTYTNPRGYDITNSSTDALPNGAAVDILHKRVASQVDQLQNNIQAVRSNMELREAWLNGKPLNQETRSLLARKDPSALQTFDKLMAQRSGSVMAAEGSPLEGGEKSPRALHSWTGIGEEKAIKKFRSDLAFNVVGYQGALAKIAQNPTQITSDDMTQLMGYQNAINTLTAPFNNGEPPLGRLPFDPTIQGRLNRYMQRNSQMLPMQGAIGLPTPQPQPQANTLTPQAGAGTKPKPASFTAPK